MKPDVVDAIVRRLRASGTGESKLETIAAVASRSDILTLDDLIKALDNQISSVTKTKLEILASPLFVTKPSAVTKSVKAAGG